MKIFDIREERSDLYLNDDQNALQLIAFSVEEQVYGVDITSVREIRAWTGATPLPNAQEHVRGVINLRGTIVPIYDLRARFGLGKTSATQTHVVVVLNLGTKWIGVLVDAVSDIITISPDDIHPVPPTQQADYTVLTGIISHDDKMVGLINLDTITSDEELSRA